MTGQTPSTSPSTSVAAAAATSSSAVAVESAVSAQDRAALARRREKPQLSCHQCRRRKLRCDRRQPSCYNCLSRDFACVYVHAPTQAGAASAARANPRLQDRLEHLEHLVTSLMSKTATTTRKSVTSQPLAPKADLLSELQSSVSVWPDSNDTNLGSMHVSASDLPYVSGDHWAAILESIADLKGRLDDDDAPVADMARARVSETPDYGISQDGYAPEHCLLLYGSHRPTSREEILAALPPRSVVDRYLSCYFNRLGLAYDCVHAPTFLREYQLFWSNPSERPIMWIGLLYSMISLASFTFEDAAPFQIDVYREKLVQCLIMGEYTKAGPHALETLFHYIHVEFARQPDAPGDLWFLQGLIVNMAKRAGYHRDPESISRSSAGKIKMTLLEIEMRRRMWACVLLGDVLVSSQMGMPCMITPSQWDTKEPKNFDDNDLEADNLLREDSKGPLVSPPSPRPETEFTRVLSTIAGRRLSIAVIAISAAANNPYSTDAEVAKLDHMLNQAGEAIPAVLKLRTIETSITDSPQVIMSRLFLSHIFHKGKIMLHRRYLHRPEFSSNPQSSEKGYLSRKACLDSSLSTLEIQRILDEETRPGGQLQVMRWRVSSIMNHQFLTATMVLCSLLYKRGGMSQEEEQKIQDALRISRSIWVQSSPWSQEAKRATEVIGAVLSKAPVSTLTGQNLVKLNNRGSDGRNTPTRDGLSTSNMSVDGNVPAYGNQNENQSARGQFEDYSQAGLDSLMEYIDTGRMFSY